MSEMETASRAFAPKVECRAASMGDMPKQGSGPQRSRRDSGTIAQALAVVYEECDRLRLQSDKAKQDNLASDMYRFNTALHAMWGVAGKIAALAVPEQEG